MTGFGAAEGGLGGRRVRVEIRTVNHRWFNLSLRLPTELAGHEGALRELLRQGFSRGHLSVTVAWSDPAPASAARVDHERALEVVGLLRELRDRLALAGDVTLEQVLRFPEVLGTSGAAAAAGLEELVPLVQQAMAACTAERGREGGLLAAEIGRRVDGIETGMRRVGTLLPERLDRELARLRLTVRVLLEGVDPDPARLAQEIALLADRVDVTEEMVRLGAHLAATRIALAGDGPVGKSLGFLAQEIGREVNTIGSKANDAAIAHEVVAMKGDLEKIREQVENLE